MRMFEALFDDAAIFPPGNASMPAAVAAHRAHRTSPYAPTVGPFVCSDARWDELTAVLRAETTDDPRTLDISLVVPGGAAGLADALARASSEPRVRLSAVEVAGVRSPEDAADVVRAVSSVLGGADRGLPVFVELPLGEDLPRLLAPVARGGCLVKIRTGGESAASFPDEASLAAALMACVESGTAFKLTAGLHHAVRHRDSSTGFEHHGFHNVLAAVAAAVGGRGAADMAAVLAERDATTLASVVGAAEADPVRSRFRSFGTCSVTEPVQDLVDLGLLPPVGSDARVG